MTDDQMQTMRDDIAYMKALAQEGRQAPILGGSILVASGTIYGLASLVHGAAAAGILKLQGLQVLWVWLGATALFMTVMVLLIGRTKRQAGLRSAANRAARAVWASVGGSIFVLGASIAVLTWKFPHSAEGMLIPSIILALWGTGWAVQAAMAQSAWMRLVAIAAWIAAPIMAFFAGQPAQFVAYAAALVVCGIIPGLVMIRQEPSDIV
jgi:hypothetical protein